MFGCDQYQTINQSAVNMNEFYILLVPVIITIMYVGLPSNIASVTLNQVYSFKWGLL